MARKSGSSVFGKWLGRKKDTSPTPSPDVLEQEPRNANNTEAPPPPVEEKSWFERMKSGLARSSSKLTQGLTSLFTRKKLDEEMLQDLEDLLIQADLGVATATRITQKLANERFDKDVSGEEVRAFLAEEIERVLEPVAIPLGVDEETPKPQVILVAGVNGAGKTTTIGKLAKRFSDEGKSVMLAAGDTFRAAAVEQLRIWAERTHSPFISRDIGADAAGLAFDALKAAQEQNIDILMIDTAGRLQNKTTLMQELEKIIRVIRKLDPSAPHTSLLVLDATTGQNALQQVQLFQKTAETTGLVMTKLDGTARGGILVAIADKYQLPIHAIGVGEQIEDLQPFNANEFARAITEG